MIKNFNNKTYKVGDDLKENIKKGSKIDIAAGIFSIYGYESLKTELNKIDQLRFIFTDPTFIEIDKSKRELRQFQINANNIKKAISGSNFEINLKNELKGKSIAKECKRWIEQKVKFKTNVGNKFIQPHLNLKNNESNFVYTGINEFSSAGFGYEKDNSILNQIIKTDDFETTKQYLETFEEIWKDEKILKDVTGEVADYISNLYKENSPEFIYYLTLFNIFDEFLEDISVDELANEKTGFKKSVIWNKLYDFQRDAVLGIINKLERHNGCILADSVGLGKTFTALGVIKYYQERNRTDLKNQIALAYEGDTGEIDAKMGISKSIDNILRNSQKIFNDWAKLPIDERTSHQLLNNLNMNFDFFKLLDSVTIARSRKHIEKYYDIEKIGKFPNRLKPITHRAEVTDLEGFMKISDLYRELSKFNMSIYSPFDYILENKKEFYDDLYDTNLNERMSFKQSHREKSLQTLMRVNLLKRLESSVDSFRITLNKFLTNIKITLKKIEDFEKNGTAFYTDSIQVNDMNLDAESDDWLSDEFSIGDKIKINLADMNTTGWKEDLKADYDIASDLLTEMQKITSKHDKKLEDLKKFIEQKIDNPINKNNKKILTFSAFADTVNYLYDNLAHYNKEKHNLETAKITGADQNKNTLNIDNSFNNILSNFSPKSKERKDKNAPEIDILIATDCISEGQNLQDCDTLINYDIHWNPVRIIQRFGRIDRIGSYNKDIQLINFWPQLSLDDYINLKSRVESKMFMVDVTATGEDNVLTNKSSDLLFRKKQLERLQEEVVDIEEMGSGVSITDLGLNEFRMDLVNYINENGDLESVPNGMHTVCKKDIEKGINEGVIFVLKNINRDVNIDNTNQLHPFYLVYIKENGEILSNHLNVKNTLDMLRLISKGKDAPIKEVYEIFNNETEDGKKMDKYSNLLNNSIKSILNVKDEKDVDSLFSSGGTTALVNNIKGLEDFELITFIVVK